MNTDGAFDVTTHVVVQGAVIIITTLLLCGMVFTCIWVGNSMAFKFYLSVVHVQ